MDNILITLNNLGYLYPANIGAGSYGAIFKVSTLAQKHVAIKIIYDRSYSQRGMNNLIELDILSRFQHPNLVNINKFFIMDKILILEMPLFEYDLLKFLEKYDDIPSNIKLSLMYDVACGIDMLHNFNILHLDVKPENVLVKHLENGYYRAVLTDFGFALKVPDIVTGIKSKLVRVSFIYRPFDILLPDEQDNYFYNNKTDIWSYGLTFLTLMTESDIFKTGPHTNDKLVRYLHRYYFISSDIDLTMRFFRTILIKKPGLHKLVWPLLKNILIYDSTTRYNIQQILSHKLFADFHDTDGTVFLVDKSGNNEMNYNIIPNIQKIENLAKVLYPHKSVEILFLATDLFYNCFMEITRRDLLSITCLWMAAKYIDPYCEDLPMPYFSPFILSMEKSVVRYLNGNINNGLIFAISNSLEELIEYYVEYILYGNYEKYFSIDINKLQTLSSVNIIDLDPRFKNISIKDFLHAIQNEVKTEDFNINESTTQSMVTLSINNSAETIKSAQSLDIK